VEEMKTENKVKQKGRCGGGEDREQGEAERNMWRR
jgi:hypothetical protein